MLLKYSEYQKYIYIIQGKWIHVGNCLKNGAFTFLFSVYIFTFILCGEQKHLFTKK